MVTASNNVRTFPPIVNEMSTVPPAAKAVGLAGFVTVTTWRVGPLTTLGTGELSTATLTVVIVAFALRVEPDMMGEPPNASAAVFPSRTQNCTNFREDEPIVTVM